MRAGWNVIGCFGCSIPPPFALRHARVRAGRSAERAGIRDELHGSPGPAGHPVPRWGIQFSARCPNLHGNTANDLFQRKVYNKLIHSFLLMRGTLFFFFYLKGGFNLHNASMKKHLFSVYSGVYGKVISSKLLSCLRTCQGSPGKLLATGQPVMIGGCQGSGPVWLSCDSYTGRVGCFLNGEFGKGDHHYDGWG